jgi:hypothetical protein
MKFNVEYWLERNQQKLALVRTIAGVVAGVATVVVALRVFEVLR